MVKWKSIQNSRIGAKVILQMKQVRQPGAILVAWPGSWARQQTKARARQEPRHPPGARRHGKRNNNHRTDHDPELWHKNVQSPSCIMPQHAPWTRGVATVRSEGYGNTTAPQCWLAVSVRPEGHLQYHHTTAPANSFFAVKSWHRKKPNNRNGTEQSLLRNSDSFRDPKKRAQEQQPQPKKTSIGDVCVLEQQNRFISALEKQQAREKSHDKQHPALWCSVRVDSLRVWRRQFDPPVQEAFFPRASAKGSF